MAGEGVILTGEGKDITALRPGLKANTNVISVEEKKGTILTEKEIETEIETETGKEKDRDKCNT